jgi:excisionase family DNA binding protein
MDQSNLLTIPEFAAGLRLKTSTIRAWILQRRIPHYKLGGRVMLHRSDLEELICKSRVPAKQPGSGV